MFANVIPTLAQKLLPPDYKPFPVYEDRAGWAAVSRHVQAQQIAAGERYHHYNWPTTPATVFMEFARNGNRSRYEQIIADRRMPLIQLMLAECCEGKGRFIDDIINGLWTTMEESTWMLPACNNHYTAPALTHDPDMQDRALPDAIHPENIFIDLFNAETASVIAFAYYALGDRLHQESPQIPQRMAYELERRIFTPFLTHEDFFWMGDENTVVNNWNPWIVANILTCTAFACHDADRRAAIVAKCLRHLEYFVRVYAPDGGCDEGPAYWSVAGASLFDCMDILRDMTGGQVDMFDQPLLHNMCTYIYKTHISQNYFVNYADAKAVVPPDAAIIYRMGRIFQDETLVRMGVAAYNAQQPGGAAQPPDRHIWRGLKRMFVDAQLAAEPDRGYPIVRDVWFPGIQVVAARQQAGSDAGLYLSAKGGHNQESHNHNDVGTFVLYADGRPAVVDIGTAVYERKTFSAQRYELLQMQSQYHNLPIIGGVGQLDGIQRAAKNVVYTAEDAGVHFEMELQDAYPDAGIQVWRRGFDFARAAGRMMLTDTFALAAPQTVEFVFIVAAKPVFAGGKMRLPLAQDNVVTMTYDDALQPTVTHFATAQDANLCESWGEAGLWRVVLATPQKVIKGRYSFVFAQDADTAIG